MIKKIYVINLEKMIGLHYKRKWMMSQINRAKYLVDDVYNSTEKINELKSRVEHITTCVWGKLVRIHKNKALN